MGYPKCSTIACLAGALACGGEDSPGHVPTAGGATEGGTTEASTGSGGSTDTTGPTTSSSTTDDEGDTDPPAIPPNCGDGHLDADEGELCDEGDGNAPDADCTPACAPNTCGDGYAHGTDEECDDGDANDETAWCTHLCTVNVCGDGFHHIGEEECDDGNAIDTDACLTGCKDPICGDGIVSEGEDCEGEAVNEMGKVCAACKWVQSPDVVHTVFVSSALFYGDMSVDPESIQGQYEPSDFPGGEVGVDLADLRCQQLAGLGELDNPHRFVAWLSEHSGGDAIDRLNPTPSHGYLDTNGTMIIANWPDFAQSGPLEAIARTEGNESVTEKLYVWSNSDAAGKSLGKIDPQTQSPTSCGDWANQGTEQSPLFGERGHIASEHPQWTDIQQPKGCKFPQRLYCFERPPPP